MDKIRSVILTPYRKGAGPRFRLTMWDTGTYDHRGCTRIAYQLREVGGPVIFAGEDFSGSPMHADDSDATVAGLLGFLTLKPGDTDADYFADYTPEQRAFCEAHAEVLAWAAEVRFVEKSRR
jgi:hypothetical protein